MSRYSYDPEAYEKRYRKVYEIGAEFWEQLEPTETLVKFVSETRMPKRSRVIEFGCGEGRDSVFLSRKRFRLLGVDTARSALVNAKRRSEKGGRTRSSLLQTYGACRQRMGSLIWPLTLLVCI
jgi:cyclopropane fatty-acyl-phospholipid synthase-like methyltransferase